MFVQTCSAASHDPLAIFVMHGLLWSAYNFETQYFRRKQTGRHINRLTNTALIGRTYFFCEWLLELVDLQGCDEGDVIKAIVRRRLLLQLIRQSAAQLHHGCSTA